MKTILLRVALVSLAACLAWPRCSLAAATGSLAGIVVDDQSHPVARATVVYRLIRQGRTDAYGHHIFADPITTGRVASGADGRFTVGNLQMGQYEVCAFGPLPNQVPSCLWAQGAGPSLATVGATPADIRLLVRSGVRLHVHVQDPNGSAEVDNPFRVSDYSRRLQLAVLSSKGEYYPVNLASKGQGQLEFGLAVPRDRNVGLVVNTDLTVVDSAGKALAKGSPKAVTEPEQSDGVHVYLSVRGK